MTFITRHWRGLTLVALGLITVLGAHFFLDSCADAGKFVTTSMGAQMRMGCSWTERAVQGLGGLVALVGLIMLATPLWLIPT